MSDLIDRQALLDECLNHYEVGNIEQNCTMDWICKTVRNFPAASPWHRVEEKPKEGTWCVIAKHSYLQPHNLFYDIAHYLHGIFSVYDSVVGDWFDGKPLYWMPIEPPKEEEHGN